MAVGDRILMGERSGVIAALPQNKFTSWWKLRLDGEEKVLRRIKRRARREARLKALDAEERERQALRKQIEGLRKKRRELLEQRASLLARVRELQGFG